MKKRIFMPFLALASLLLSGCGLFTPVNSNEGDTSGSTSSGETDTSESDSSSSSGQQGDEEYQYSIANPNTAAVIRASKSEVTYEDLFNLNNKVSIELTVPRTEFEKIAHDNELGHKPEMYRLATNFKLTMVNGSNTFVWELENVGIRQKGNTSRDSIFKGEELNNRNHFKLKFDETFTDVDIYGQDFVNTYGNIENEEREFLGLDGLDFKWDKNNDLTHIKEMYTNEMYRACGVMAQHVGLSTIRVKYGESQYADFGLCYIYEPVNKTFIKRTLQSDKSYIGMSSWSVEKAGKYGVSGKKYGDLYKCTYGNGNGSSSSGASLLADTITGKKVGVKTDIYGNDYPAYERKTNKKETYDDGLLKNLVNVLNRQSTTYQDIEGLVDLKYLAMSEAISFVVGSPDSLRDNYNNYQMYFRRTDGKAVIIPIDNDRTLGIGKDWGDSINYILSNDTQDPLHLRRVYGTQENPLLVKTTLSRSSNKAKTAYLSCVEAVRASDWCKEATFKAYYDVAKATYQEFASFSLQGDGENLSFKEAITRKRAERAYPENENMYVIGSFNNWGSTLTNLNLNNYGLQGGEDDSGNWNTNIVTATFEIEENYDLWNTSLSKDEYIEFAIGTYDHDNQRHSFDIAVVPGEGTSIQRAEGDIHNADRFVLKASVGDVVEMTIDTIASTYTLRKIDNILTDMPIDKLNVFDMNGAFGFYLEPAGENLYVSKTAIYSDGTARLGFYVGGRKQYFLKATQVGEKYFLSFGGKILPDQIEMSYTSGQRIYISISTGEVYFA